MLTIKRLALCVSLGTLYTLLGYAVTWPAFWILRKLLGESYSRYVALAFIFLALVNLVFQLWRHFAGREDEKEASVSEGIYMAAAVVLMYMHWLQSSHWKWGALVVLATVIGAVWFAMLMRELGKPNLGGAE